ncbi:MAG TPA: hypothetical protein VGU64_21615, partial [Terriglobales bacterium]|nr:hypothetical protein [Terriglobales bacterium]
MRQIHKSAWVLVLLSAILQILIFPLSNLYMLCWVAVAPLLAAILRARPPATLQVSEGIKLVPASPLQGFLLGYFCGLLWYAGTCYWIYNTMRQYGGVNAPAAVGILILFSLYLGIYHGVFGLFVTWLAGNNPVSRRALVLSPFIWVAIELARTRISGFPWDLLGVTQVDNIPLARVATVTGAYGVSFEIMVVNVAVAAALLLYRDRVRRKRRNSLLLASVSAIVVLQAGRLVNPPALPGDHVARLVQQNIPAVEGSDWTEEYFKTNLKDLTSISLTTPNGERAMKRDLIVWPESPAPFYTTDPTFRDAISNTARESKTWVLAGGLGIRNASQTPQQATE